MSQSTLIAGALIVGYVFYTALKGTLPQYIAIFGFGSAPATTATTNTLGGASSVVSGLTTLTKSGA